LLKFLGLNAHKVVERNLDTIEQLQKINSYANELLDLLMRWNRGDEGALQLLESQVKKVRVKGPRELAIKAMAEIRGQLSLQLDIFKTLYDVQAVADFQRDVLDAIGEVSTDVRNRIVQKLKERRTLRNSASIN